MSNLIINIGKSANDKGGDLLRVAFDKINKNFSTIWPRSVPLSSTGTANDTAGMVAFDDTYSYFCISDYTGVTSIWRRVLLPSETW